ncbi:MAG: CtsR family transcriptional regulator [Peptostreptococcaceae bacterium]
MASMTDIIEEFIKNLMKDNSTIQIQRNELANLFNCAPSQINYVLTTRFTADRGYYIESKKGGGGYVQIIKMQSDKQSHLEQLIKERIGTQISYKRAKDILDGLEEMDLINEKEMKIILYSIDEKALCVPASEQKEEVRANVLKNIIGGLLSINRT